MNSKLTLMSFYHYQKYVYLRFVITSEKCVDKEVKSTVLILGIHASFKFYKWWKLISGGVAISDRRRDPKAYFTKTRGRHIIHPERGLFGGTVIYNFALIRLGKPIVFSRYPHIKPACLPSYEGDVTVINDIINIGKINFRKLCWEISSYWRIWRHRCH